MSDFFVVEPEVAGRWGANIVTTRAPGQPVKVNKLHYEFEGWLGDSLVESTPCYVGTEDLAQAITAAELCGVHFDDVEVTKSEQFEELYPGRDLPNFLWFKFDGIPQQDDFGVTPELQLVVSRRALALLREYGLDHADVDAFDG